MPGSPKISGVHSLSTSSIKQDIYYILRFISTLLISYLQEFKLLNLIYKSRYSILWRWENMRNKMIMITKLGISDVKLPALLARSPVQAQ